MACWQADVARADQRGGSTPPYLINKLSSTAGNTPPLPSILSASFYREIQQQPFTKRKQRSRSPASTLSCLNVFRSLLGGKNKTTEGRRNPWARTPPHKNAHQTTTILHVRKKCIFLVQKRTRHLHTIKRRRAVPCQTTQKYSNRTDEAHSMENESVYSYSCRHGVSSSLYAHYAFVGGDLISSAEPPATAHRSHTSIGRAGTQLNFSHFFSSLNTATVYRPTDRRKLRSPLQGM